MKRSNITAPPHNSNLDWQLILEKNSNWQLASLESSLPKEETNKASQLPSLTGECQPLHSTATIDNPLVSRTKRRRPADNRHLSSDKTLPNCSTVQQHNVCNNVCTIVLLYNFEWQRLATNIANDRFWLEIKAHAGTSWGDLSKSLLILNWRF